jgi:DNA polymerase I-like protein with 3'-5' exonuclease and polymerase domains
MHQSKGSAADIIKIAMINIHKKLISENYIKANATSGS